MTPTDPRANLPFSRLNAEAYDAIFDARAAAGQNVHGEADFLDTLGVRGVLDAGCGTGRIGRELARRGYDVVGVDLAEDMLAVARRRAPGVRWIAADLATVDVGRTFDAVLLAGNVMIFLAPDTEAAVLENMRRHLRPGGALVVGFQLLSGYLTVSRYDALCGAAGLTLEARYSTWDRQPWSQYADYQLSLHRAAEGG